METIKRYSPVTFDSKPAETELRNGWEVVLAYEDEGNGPYLVDLSHIAKWDVQHAHLSQIQPMGTAIPQTPRACIFKDSVFINRLNQTQASVWHICGLKAEMPEDSAYTDITDVFAMLALFGADNLSIMEKVTALDLQPHEKQSPFLIQGPVLHVPCQIVIVEKDALLIAFSRGYAHSMSEAFLEAGSQCNLKPAGELVFSNYIKTLTLVT
ncbi:MAG: sarcosine oxidase subunit gamma SoxG [Desulfobacterales bacterium]|nr:MAG: sarcosine oxidase subunit gamma SoxG [Desulfobacterales bacterium]